MSEMQFPLTLLDRPFEFVAWQSEVGPQEADRQLKDATTEYMKETGDNSRAILEVSNKFINCTIQLQEFLTGNLKDLEDALYGERYDPNDPRNES